MPKTYNATWFDIMMTPTLALQMLLPSPMSISQLDNAGCADDQVYSTGSVDGNILLGDELDDLLRDHPAHQRRRCWELRCRRSGTTIRNSAQSIWQAVDVLLL